MLKKYLHKLDKMKMLGRLLGCLLAFALFTYVAPLQMAYAAVTPPPRTTSWYMDTPNPTWLPNDAYDMGCALGAHDLNTPGTQDNVVILLFGRPWVTVKGVYGTKTWTAMGGNNFVFVSTAQIAAAARQFARGYWQCTGPGDTTSQLYLAVGTSNQGSSVTNVGGVTKAHGSAWARMTKNIDAWVGAMGYYTQIKIRAASDMELGFNGPAATKAWVSGYAAAYGVDVWLYDVGDAAGCPFPGMPNWHCGTTKYPDWTSEDLWYIAWGAAPAYPIPEIYTPSGVSAGQWYYLSRYSYKNHNKSSIYFPGALTESQACSQVVGGCPGLDNTSAQGWTQLWNLTRADPQTSQPFQRWSTDMKWH